MSPTTRVGEADPNRGTAPVVFTAGRYDGKVALVTGAGSGIGRATARRLAAEGAAVACLDVAEDAVSFVADEINADGVAGHAIALRLDVTNEDMVAAVVAEATAVLGPVTNLCNIAGIGGFAHTTDQSYEGWKKILSVNLDGTFLMCRAVLPTMLDAVERSSTRCRQPALSASPIRLRTAPPKVASKCSPRPWPSSTWPAACGSAASPPVG